MPWRESAAELERARAERPVTVPAPRGALFGIFTPAATTAPARDLCVVFFTRPRSHRNRMWVEGARRLAGDSEGDSGWLDPNRPYRDDAAAVLRFLRERLEQRRFVLSGACFDARTALSAFADEGGHIAGLAFTAAPLMELETLVKADADRKDLGHLWRALRNPENWRALARPARWRYMAQVPGRVARRSVGAREQALPLSASFLEHFEALCRSRARALFLYGDRDAEYQSFQVALAGLFPRLDPAVRARFEIEVWPGLVHDGYLEMERQREVVERTLGWIEALPARLAGSRSGRAGAAPEASWTSA